MVRESEGELFKSKTCVWSLWEESNGQFGVMQKYGNWFHSRCAKIEKVTARLSTRFVCSRCRGIMDGTVDSIE